MLGLLRLATYLSQASVINLLLRLALYFGSFTQQEDRIFIIIGYSCLYFINLVELSQQPKQRAN